MLRAHRARKKPPRKKNREKKTHAREPRWVGFLLTPGDGNARSGTEHRPFFLFLLNPSAEIHGSLSLRRGRVSQNPSPRRRGLAYVHHSPDHTIPEENPVPGHIVTQHSTTMKIKKRERMTSSNFCGISHGVRRSVLRTPHTPSDNKDAYNQAHREKSTVSTRFSALVIGLISVFSVVVVDKMDERFVLGSVLPVV